MTLPKYISVRFMREKLKWSLSDLSHLEKENALPKRKVLPTGEYGWTRAEIVKWMVNCISYTDYHRINSSTYKGPIH